MASAASIAYEGFDYPDTATLGGQSGGSGWGQAWQLNKTDSDIVSPGLSPDGNSNSLVVTGNHAQGSVAGDGTNVDLQRNLDSTQSGDFWASFIFNTDGNATTNVLFKDSGNFVWASLGSNISVNENLGSNSSANAVTGASADTDYFGVLRYQRNAGTNDDALDLWVNPDLTGTSPSNSLGSASLTMSDGELGALQQARWQVKGSEGDTAELDELRIDDSFADVTPVPSPSALATGLVLLGLGTMLGRPRRS
jgi:hypothetical protein